MNKKSVINVIVTLAVILLISFMVYYFVIPLIENDKKSYSQSNCLNDQITQEMDIYDIAKLYRDNACVAVTVTGQSGLYNYTSLGSGVCIAGHDYETDLGYTSTGGYYIATNYHVVDMALSGDYSNIEIEIITEDELSYGGCKILWYSKDFDLAIIYCGNDQLQLDYIKMKDRVVNCDESDKIDIEQIFTIGSPLDLQNLNDFTTGYVRNNSLKTEYTGFYKYYYQQSIFGGFGNQSSWQSTEDEDEVPDGATYYPLAYIDNVYEDVVSMSVEISPGNSGGGVFDAKGNLIGLATLSTSVSSSNGNQINGFVSIYPLIQVLDRVIYNNENSGNDYSIYDLENLDLVGIDSQEAGIIYSIKFQQENDVDYGSVIRTISEFADYYYLDGVYYSESEYQSAFTFEDDGYYIITNDSTISNMQYLSAGVVITQGKIGSETYTIENRNDFLYMLLDIDDGESVTFTYLKDGISSSVTVQF